MVLELKKFEELGDDQKTWIDAKVFLNIMGELDRRAKNVEPNKEVDEATMLQEIRDTVPKLRHFLTHEIQLGEGPKKWLTIGPIYAKAAIDRQAEHKGSKPKTVELLQQLLDHLPYPTIGLEGPTP